MSLLNEIALKYGTDKSSKTHNYCDIYEFFFNPLIDKNITLVEIGVLYGNSINMWREYFKKAKLIGLDIDKTCKRFEKIENNLFIEIGRQEDINFLKSVIEKYGPIDIIIDDGSHFGDDQITTFEYIFPTLKPKGLYIIEDLHCSFCKNYGGHGINGISNPPKQPKQELIQYLKDVITNINCDGTGGAYQERLKIIGNSNYNFKSSMIKAITFYTSICIIEKF